MTSINPINVNAGSITASYGYGSNSKTQEKEEKDNQAPSSASRQSSVSANDVLNYMAQSAIAVTPAATSAVDTAKYVDGESASRISNFMSQFEDIVATNLTAISQEFPGMSTGAQQTVALAQAGSAN